MSANSHIMKHSWNLNRQEALMLQRQLARQVIRTPGIKIQDVTTDIPSIGCAKTWLSGRYTEPVIEKGSYSYLRDGKEIVGAVVRTRRNVKPLFVSIGHRINLQNSIRIVLKCCRRYRLPESIRLAHQIASELGK